MNEIAKSLIMSFATIPVAYVILKLIFKKSIMFTFSIITVAFTIFASAMDKTQVLANNPILNIITTPLNVALGALVYVYINKLLRKPLETAINQVKEISEGNLSIKTQGSTKADELGVLTNSIHQLTEKLKDVIGNFLNNTESMVGASQQVSSTSEQLSQGATEQASSIEEVSSTLEEITANIEQNTHNAKETEAVSNSASGRMQEISDKSQQAIEATKAIAEKITIVNDIAFQTNILALNAAVEAARAGEHGKGFAVVAAEVRKLAENSKKAAEEIVQLATKGLNITEESGGIMLETIPQIENTSKLVQEIAAASTEQSSGANQVNSAIQQLNHVTQSNAAASEELATSAEELAGQAEQLRDLIAYFRVK